jgi:aspartate 1-decarboxylase
VLVVSNTSDARLETYVIAGERASGAMCMNGAAAHLIKKGEQVIVMGFELTDEPVVARTILVDRRNRFVRDLSAAAGVIVADALTTRSAVSRHAGSATPERSGSGRSGT